MAPHLCWRVHVTKVNHYPTSDHAALAEVEFHGITAADQATGGTPIFSSQFDGGGHAAARAFDNTLNNQQWTSQLQLPASPAEWVGYQFAAPVEVYDVAIWNMHDAPWWQWRSPVDFTIDHADDPAGPWTTALAIVGETWHEGLERKEYSVTPRFLAEVAALGAETVLGGSDVRATVAGLALEAVLGTSPARANVAVLAVEAVIGPPLAVSRVAGLAAETVLGASDARATVAALGVEVIMREPRPRTFTRAQIL